MASVLREIDLFGGPEGGFGLLVHLPDLGILNGEHAEAIRVRGEERLIGNGRHGGELEEGMNKKVEAVKLGDFSMVEEGVER